MTDSITKIPDTNEARRSHGFPIFTDDYVGEGFELSLDATDLEVFVAQGQCYIADSGDVYDVEANSRTLSVSDGTTTDLYYEVTTTTGDRLAGDVVTGGSLGSGPSLKIGEVDTTADTVDDTINRSPSLAAGSVETEHVGNVTYASGYDSLQAAVNNAKDGWVLVDGRFKISPPLTITGGVSLIGTPAERGSIQGSAIIADSPATNLIEVDGPGQGTPSGISIEGILIDGTSCTNCIQLQSDAVSLTISHNTIYKGEYGIEVNSAGPVSIINNELNQQSNHGIHLTDTGVRGCIIRDNKFEGSTQGILKADNSTAFTGFVHFIGNRCSYSNITGSDGVKLFISESTGENFYMRFADNYFFDFEDGNEAIRIGAGSGDTKCGGPLYIHDNVFNGFDRGTSSDTGTRAIQVDDEVVDELVVRNNKTKNFTGPAILNLKNSKASLEVGGNTGQAVFENRGSASVADGGTISHGLAESPDFVNLTTSTQGHIASASAVDSSSITVQLVDDAGSSVGTAETVYWEARYV